MSTSAIEREGRRALKTGFVYLCLAVFCAFAGAVYELFSHGAYSFFMRYAFAFPLLFGALPFCALALRGRVMPGRLALNFYHSGIAALSVGSLFEGALQIYGTANSLTAVYWAAGALFTAAGIVTHIEERLKRGRSA